MLTGETLHGGLRRLKFRAATAADLAFLRAVYGSTRTEELAPLPWSEADKQRFLDQQFAAQDHAYRTNYPGADFLVILVDSAPAGRLCLHRRAREIRIMDIALLPPFRGQGCGATILGRLQDLAAAEGLSLSIHVETFNPARRLYERLGFRPAGQSEVYLLLEWAPPVPTPGSPPEESGSPPAAPRENHGRLASGGGFPLGDDRRRATRSSAV